MDRRIKRIIARIYDPDFFEESDWRSQGEEVHTEGNNE